MSCSRWITSQKVLKVAISWSKDGSNWWKLIHQESCFYSSRMLIHQESWFIKKIDSSRKLIDEESWLTKKHDWARLLTNLGFEDGQSYLSDSRDISSWFMKKVDWQRKLVDDESWLINHEEYKCWKDWQCWLLSRYRDWKVSDKSDILLPGLCSSLSSGPLTGAVVHGVEESLAVPGPVPGHACPSEGRVQVEVVGLDRNI